eukprot:gene20236-24227_t
MMIYSANMLSSDGRCKTLDSAADGYVRSEACVTAIVHSSHGNRSLTSTSIGAEPPFISGSAINQDGRASSLTAPNGPAQKQVIEAALHQAGSGHIATLAAVEMHGTGTALGDPIEVGAISGVLADLGKLVPHASGPYTVPLQSMKSHVGHSEPAAGINGLLAAIAARCDGGALHIQHLRSPNAYVASILTNQLGSRSGRLSTPMQRGSCCLRAAATVTAVSSFAFQGTNAQAVVTSAGIAPSAQLKMAGLRTWEHARAWIDAAPRSAWITVHGVPAFSSSLLQLQALLHDAPRLADVYHHRVVGRALFPGAGYLHLGHDACRLLMASDAPRSTAADCALISLVLPLPCELTSGSRDAVSVTLSHCGQLDISSLNPPLASLQSPLGGHTHASGKVVCVRHALGMTQDLWDMDSRPARWEQRGQAVIQTLTTPACSLSTGRCVFGVTENEHVLHQADWYLAGAPAVLDNAMQLATASVPLPMDRAAAVPLRVPAAIAAYSTRAAVHKHRHWVAAVSAAEVWCDTSPIVSSHYVLSDDPGAMAEICGLQAKVLHRARVPREVSRAVLPPGTMSQHLYTSLLQ